MITRATINRIQLDVDVPCLRTLERVEDLCFSLGMIALEANFHLAGLAALPTLPTAIKEF